MLKLLNWCLHASRRTVLTAIPGLARPDDEWARRRLERVEFELYRQLSRPERAHAVAVARRLLRGQPQASSLLVRAALLHDVGKLGAPGFVLWRVLTHLLPPAHVEPEPRLMGLAGARQARVHHAAFGAAMIRAAGGDEAVARLVERHHDTDATGGVALLRAADDAT